MALATLIIEWSISDVYRLQMMILPQFQTRIVRLDVTIILDCTSQYCSGSWYRPTCLKFCLFTPLIFDVE